MRSHLVFTTKNRFPWIKPTFQKNLWAYLAKVLREQGAQVMIVGGMEDHVHLFFVLPMTIRGCDLVRYIKRASSVWMKENCAGCEDFHWQDSYAIFGVSESLLNKTWKYIETQPTHHKGKTCEQEMKMLLKKNGVVE